MTAPRQTINNFADSVLLEQNIVGSNPQKWWSAMIYDDKEANWMHSFGVVVNNISIARQVLFECDDYKRHEMALMFLGTVNDFYEAYGIHGATTEEIRINQECCGTYPRKITSRSEGAILLD